MKAKKILGLVVLATVSCMTPSSAAVPTQLPPGIPSPIGPDGRYTGAITFTTDAYRKEAIRLLIQEANQVATDLSLPEKRPITQADLVGVFVSPFGYAFVEEAIGNVTTRGYSYGVEHGNKFSDLTVANWDATCASYREHRLPIRQIDTNSAYKFATQWLAMARMDINALNHDCQVKVEVSAFWNGLNPGERLQKKSFVPIYDVSWVSAQNRAEGVGDVAHVSLFAPTKTLLSLTVSDPKYILRPPLVFSNLALLLSQTNSTPGAAAK